MDSVLERLKAYALLVRLHRPIGIYLLLWPTLWALWIAAGDWPRGDVLFIFLAGVVLMRSAGCAINDYADRHIDPHVARTRDRPVASGLVSPREALAVSAVLCLLAFVLVLFLNRLTVLLSLVALVLAGSYPFMKRLHHLPQVHLGAAFGWAVPMAFAAQTGEFPPAVAWLVFIAAVLWATVYDTFYAMADREDDLRLGVKSSAILFGDADRMITGVLQMLLLWCLWLVGREAGLGLWYWLGLTVAAGFALYQQYLIVDRQPVACFRAFLNNHWFGAAVFAGIFMHYALAD